jgi:holliday junction DNA helicase RuvA
MIEFLEGTLVEKYPTHIVLQCGGMAFRLLIPLSAHDQLPAPGHPARVLTHLAVREDDLTLYGFATPEERLMFERLILVSGIGPKLALTALSGMNVRELKTAIVEGDIKRLSGISGIGKKTAERVVIDLRDKIGKAEIMELSSGDAPTNTRLRDAILALVALGFKQQDAKALIDKVPGRDDPEVSVDELIRRALASR